MDGQNQCLRQEASSSGKDPDSVGATWKSRSGFLLASFVMAFAAFYLAYAERLFATPYMEEHLGVKVFTDWIEYATIFSAICAATLTILTYTNPEILDFRYRFLSGAFALEFAFVWFFFVAFFGV